MPENEFVTTAFNYEHKSDTCSVSCFLYVMEGSSTDSLHGDDPAQAIASRDRLLATPCIQITFGADGMQPEEQHMPNILAGLQATGWGLQLATDEKSIPLHVEVSSRIHFCLDEHDNLEIVGPGVLQGRSLEVHPRLAWFLRTTGTLGVLVMTSDIVYCGTLKDRGSEANIVVAMHDGSLGGKNARQLLEHSPKWIPVHVGNQSILAGAGQTEDEHTESYEVTRDKKSLPLVTIKRSDCLICRRVTNLTSEHCTPSWLVDLLSVMPLTATILCGECNSSLGQNLEVPMKILLAESRGDVPTTGIDLSKLWVFKTAIMLAAASNVAIPDDFRNALLSREVPSNTEVFFLRQSNITEGYEYTLTHFRRQLQKSGHFLTSFRIGDLVAIVVRLEKMAEHLPLIPRLHPSRTLPLTLPTSMSLQDIHHELLSFVVGKGFVFSPSVMDAAPPRKRRRRTSE